MSNKFLLSIVILTIQGIVSISSNYLEVESNYRKPLLERSNILNKGVWIKNKFKEHLEPSKIEDFIFRPNSLDVDNLLQGDFNAFGDTNVQQGSPDVTSYIERSKRSNNNEKKTRFKKSVSNCENNKNCNKNSLTIDKNSDSKFISKLKPTSVFNDPFEIATLLDNSKKALVQIKNEVEELAASQNKNTSLLIENDNDSSTLNIQRLVKDYEVFKDIYNVANELNVSTLKRSMDYATKSNKNDLEIDLNKTADYIPTNKVDRDVFDKVDATWHQSAPVSEMNRYKVMPKTEEYRKNKPVTERGLIKVLSMLTKTFKKIMRQHDDIKDIHKQMHTMNKEFVNNAFVVTEKMKDFDEKYTHLVEINDKSRLLEEKFNSKEQYFRTKEAELSNNLIEFENQQKKFLTQQRQFYNIQKLMLAQNEKINSKQNLIAKTQSEISHRQNNFARILKKAKQIYIDKHPIPPRITSTFTKVKENKTDESESVTHTTTTSPQPTESIKINLFSIPSLSRIENQDHLLLNEKDEQPVDDLVYKYYFNNTFIDNLMKNKILTSFVAASDNTETRNVKNKRNELSELHTTILLPVKKTRGVMEQLIGENLNRRKRWINHHSSRKSHRRNRGKTASEIITANDDKAYKISQPIGNLLEFPIQLQNLTPEEQPIQKNDMTMMETNSNPFLIMATSFCNGIGQNANQQMLDWCVEKALRKLQNIDTRVVPPPPPVLESKYAKPLRISNEGMTIPFPSQSPPNSRDPIVSQPTNPQGPSQPPPPPPAASTTPSSPQVYMTAAPIQFTPISTIMNVATPSFKMFFPDNDQLESNLKRYELKPDTEGNYYYEGSLHASDIMVDKSEGFSDLMLDQLESNSRIDVDPATFDLQAKRRAYKRRMNENMKKMGKGV